MTQSLEMYKAHLGLTENSLQEIVTSFEHFTQDEEKFIIDFISQTYSEQPLKEYSEGNKKIIALSGIGNSRVYFYTDGEASMVIKPGGFRELAEYKKLPIDVKESKFINPIIRISPRFDFYATPMITGIEGSKIVEKVGGKDLAGKVFELLLWSSSHKVDITTDVRAFMGHNVFFNLMTSQLILFDHGSYSYDATFDQEEILKRYLFKESLTAVSEYYAITMGTPAFQRNADNSIELSTEHQQFFIYFVELSKLLCSHFGWKTVPFYRISFRPSTREKSAETIQERGEIPLPTSEKDMALAVVNTIEGYTSPRNRVRTSTSGSQITREKALEVLKMHYGI